MIKNGLRCELAQFEAEHSPPARTVGEAKKSYVPFCRAAYS